MRVSKTGDPCSKHNHLYQKFFEREAVFTVDINKIASELSNLVKSGIIYRDERRNISHYPLFRGQQDYSAIKLKSEKLEMKTSEYGQMTWLSYPDPIEVIGKLGVLGNNVGLSELEGGILYHVGALKNGKLSFLVHFSNPESDKVTDRITEILIAYNNEIGENTVSIQEISGLVEGLPAFFKKYDLKQRVIELSFSFPHRGKGINLIAVPKSFEERDLKFVTDQGGKVHTAKYDELCEVFNKDETNAAEILSRTFKQLPFTIYRELICNGDSCCLNVIFEEKFAVPLTRVLTEMIRLGLRLRIERYDPIV